MWCEVGFVSLMELLLSVYLHVIIVHVAGGCILANHGRELKIEADLSDTILLPCYCADLNTTTQSFLWTKMNETSRNMLDRTDGKRVQLVVGSPGNFSLLITNLTLEDKGFYRCESRAGHYTDIRLIIKGSHEIIHGDESTITAHVGTSTLLPCHSTELNTIPKKFLWRKYSRSKATWDDMSIDGQKFQLLNDHFPGNLSLLISHLSQEDEGVYRCDLGRDKYTDVKLVVKVAPEPLPFIPVAMVTVIFLHMIVAGVYCTTRKKALPDPARVLYSTAGGDGNVNLEW
ncbi:polymeric immunoglobulin receptor-like [Hemibagrus wyckioides]|uniref:polymeric immunoglobulin receptor-like n=1 Tax=Hemibagrus wyckioides TaxID=337641 RepID=UPI00266D314D|nr:polymeric immunoglobulin receptor-like [Hemibagrus wyckioides]